MEKIKANVLGTEYTIEFSNPQDDSRLIDLDGYCDSTAKKIVISEKRNDCEFINFESYQRQVMRHELIHAFHCESGIDCNLECKEYGFPETIVDWFAIQYPKIEKAFKEVGCDY